MFDDVGGIGHCEWLFQDFAASGLILLLVVFHLGLRYFECSQEIGSILIFVHVLYESVVNFFQIVSRNGACLPVLWIAPAQVAFESFYAKKKRRMATKITKFRTSIQYIHSQKVASVAHQKVPISVVNSL
jgi:hypothetical protein